MCGIAGFIKKDILPEQSVHLIEKMVQALRHRGPDGRGVWTDPKNGVALGHTRLFTFDRSATGDQPFVSASKRSVIVYDGEVYNYKEVQLDLAKDGIFVKGSSDAEVVLEAIERWGLERALPRFNGKFAFALWDIPRNSLTLVRDRIGIKPLYYGWLGKTFVFASELKAIEQFAAGRLTLDPGVLDQYLRFGYLPAPLSIYREISKLPSGSMLQLDSSEKGADPVRYWSVSNVARAGRANMSTLNEAECTEELDTLLADAVRLRMEAEVPIGTFLSGGVDSSLVVTLMQKQSGNPIKTFSVGFGDEEYNEGPSAIAVANYLKTSHSAVVLRDQDVIRTVLKLPFVYDEPFGDASEIPTCLVSEVARRSVAVSLNGVGADVFFGGHPRYLIVSKLADTLATVPYWIRHFAGTCVGFFGGNFLGSISRNVGAILSSDSSGSLRAQNLMNLEKLLKTPIGLELYDLATTQWTNPDEILERKLGLGGGRVSILHDGTMQEQMMCIDQQTYLPDDVLVRFDRATMAAGMQSREPFLDHRITEYVWRIPHRYKVNGDVSKYILKKVLAKYLPQEMINRPKKSLRAPIGMWLKGLLRDWAEDLLDTTKMSQEGFFNVPVVRERWEDHLEGKGDWQHPLWTILMFQAWMRAR